MRYPLISIIIPCFNRERLVADAIESALRQSYSNFEIIVVDDGSSDESWSVISSYKPKVVAIRSENQGVSAARNKGIAAASGDYIVFLDSDDLFETTALCSYVKALNQYEHTFDDKMRTVLVGKCRTIDDNGKLTFGGVYRIPNRFDFKRLDELQIVSAWAPNYGSFFPKSLLAAINCYDERLYIGEDYDLNVRIIDNGGVFFPIASYTYRVRVHDGPRLTRRISREGYYNCLEVFRSAWEKHRVNFQLKHNEESRIRFAQWVWSMGRSAYRAGETEVGNRFIHLALEIAGKEAWNGSRVVRFMYQYLAPSSVERLVSLKNCYDKF